MLLSSVSYQSSTYRSRLGHSFNAYCIASPIFELSVQPPFFPSSHS
jgi:hypothetical protein